MYREFAINMLLEGSRWNALKSKINSRLGRDPQPEITQPVTPTPQPTTQATKPLVNKPQPVKSGNFSKGIRRIYNTAVNRPGPAAAIGGGLLTAGYISGKMFGRKRNEI